jgi:subtilisin family serine protease
MKPEKLSSDLLMALADYEAQGTVGLERHAHALSVHGAQPAEGKPARAVVFIHTDPEADLAYLEKEGIKVNQRTGTVRTAQVPMEAVGTLSEDERVSRIEASRYLQLRMDVARGAVRLPAFRGRTGLSGRGVVIGVVDSGIDAGHPAFQGRILRLWDQTLQGPGVPEGAYGVEFVKPQAPVASLDTNGHGTHVAGIASGAHPALEGVAPDAELVIVKSDLSDAHIADGIRYIFCAAGNRAAVVNLSLGGHWDAHDGTDSLSLSVDQESGPGRIVCCAAGNEGSDNIRARIQVPAGATRRVRFQAPPNGSRAGYINGWYSGAAQVAIAVRAPSGSVTPFQPVLPGNATGTYPLIGGTATITTPSPDPVNGDFNFLAQVRAGLPGTPLTGVWSVLIRNTGATPVDVDLWAPEGRGGFVIFTGTSVRDDTKIGSPGASASAITVASYTTKVQWTDGAGNGQQVAMALNDISDFSSEGPLRNGAQKPDVAAPGAMIAAARSSASNVPPGFVLDPHYRINAGTSMATPFISGLVALMLERDGTLDPAAVKALLRNASAIPGQGAGAFDPKWGFGLVDADSLP